MPKINRLSRELSNLIAAGEVVERPASAVKELIENAADAGASSITTEIKSGGITMIRVTDNGCGIAADDLETAFLRHATSKIAAPEDLDGIETMGFRGEALAAIAAVSKIEMYSKTPDAQLGRRICLEGGAVISDDEAGCPDGTSITVSSLFFNTPARHKFLKKDATEASYVENACRNAALARPEISMKYIRDGETVLHSPGDGDRYSAVYCVFGRDFARELLGVDYTFEGIRVTGYTAKPTASRGSRSMQYFFVNDRPVKNRTVQSALEGAYKNRIMTGKFPAAVLSIYLDPHLVDVNIHPSKTEIKFSDERKLFEAVYYAVKQSLEELDRPDEISIPSRQPLPEEVCVSEAPKKLETVAQIPTQEPKPAVAFPSAVPAEKPKLADYTPAAGTFDLNDPGLFARADAVKEARAPALVYKKYNNSAAESDIINTPSAKLQPPPAREPWKLIGEAMGVYIIVQQGDKLVLIDKHAAHERMMFNKLKAQNGSVTTQGLIEPLVLRFAPGEARTLLDNIGELSRLGFDISDFGNSELAVRSIPYCVTPQDVPALLSELADKLASGGTASLSVFDSLLYSLACKSAVRSGDPSEPIELEKIAGAVLDSEDVRFCPHGRPVTTFITRAELEKQFRRIV